MWRRVLSIVAVVCLLCATAVAFAQKPKGPYQRIQVVDIDDGDTIVGGVRTPDGNVVLPDPRPIFKTLIEYRYNFTPEMVASSQDI